MKKFTTLFIAAFVLLSFEIAHSQQLSPLSDTLVWEVNQLTDTVNNVTVAYECTFETYGGNKIVWKQQNNYVTQFIIGSVSGPWINTSQNGYVIYQATYLGNGCTLRFFKDSEGAKITIDLIENGTSVFAHIFHVNAITAKP